MIAVVEVGPVAVRGPGSAALQRSRQAIDCIDDPIALLDDRPLPVSRLWSDVLDGAAGGGGGPRPPEVSAPTSRYCDGPRFWVGAPEPPWSS